ncbi:MAG: ATP-binding protein [Acidobacteriaceae bacterium]
MSLFTTLPGALGLVLREANPWWQNNPLVNVPEKKRWPFETLYRRLTHGLAPITVLRGPRQIGKTTLLNQMVLSLLKSEVDPTRIFRVQFDELLSFQSLKMANKAEPVLEMVHWYSESILGMDLDRALAGGPVFLLLDEVQNLPNWAPQLKYLVDIHQGLRVLVTGSSALRIEAGRDSLAGRIQTLDIGPLVLREIAEWRFGTSLPQMLKNGATPLKEKSFWLDLLHLGEQHKDERDQAYLAFSERGGYPAAQTHPDQSWEEVAGFLTETVIKRAIQHDLRFGVRGKKRDEHLLEEVFRLACRYAGQAPTPSNCAEQLRSTMGANVGVQLVRSYFKFLDGTLLLRMIEPLELRLKKRKGHPKICLCDHALRAAWLREVIPLDPAALKEAPHLSDLAGRIAESTAGYFLRSLTGLDIAHFPGRGNEPEVDFVLTIGEQRIPVEIKYRRRIDYADTHGLRSFIEKSVNNAPFGILVTLEDGHGTDDPRIISLPLSTMLLMR